MTHPPTSSIIYAQTEKAIKSLQRPSGSSSHMKALKAAGWEKIGRNSSPSPPVTNTEGASRLLLFSSKTQSHISNFWLCNCSGLIGLAQQPTPPKDWTCYEESPTPLSSPLPILHCKHLGA